MILERSSATASLLSSRTCDEAREKIHPVNGRMSAHLRGKLDDVLDLSARIRVAPQLHVLSADEPVEAYHNDVKLPR